MNAYRLNDGQNHNLTLKQVEWTVKKYKSHRRIPDTFDDKGIAKRLSNQKRVKLAVNRTVFQISMLSEA